MKDTFLLFLLIAVVVISMAFTVDISVEDANYLPIVKGK